MPVALLLALAQLLGQLLAQLHAPLVKAVDAQIAPALNTRCSYKAIKAPTGAGLNCCSSKKLLGRLPGQSWWALTPWRPSISAWAWAMALMTRLCWCAPRYLPPPRATMNSTGTTPALVQQLKKGVLAIGARLTPDDRGPWAWSGAGLRG